jgi:hypothetical protein
VIFEVLPVLAALLVHAVGHGRWLLVVPIAAGLAVAAARGFSLRYSAGRLLLAGAVTAAAALLFSAPPPGPIPPLVLAPLCGALVGMSALCALSRNTVYAWIYAGLLALLSLNGPPGALLYGALAALGICTLAVVALRGRVGIAPFAAFAALVAGGTFALAQLGFSSERWVTEAVYHLSQRAGLRMLGLDSALSLRARSTVERSMAPLFEVRGESRELHLRTVVFDVFDGSTWSTSRDLQRLQLDPKALPPAAGELELTLFEPLGDVVPAPAGGRGASLELRGGWVVRAPQLSGKTLVLQTSREELPLEAPPGPLLTSLPEALRGQLSSLRFGPPRAIESALRDGYEYSLQTDLSSPDKRHPLVVLLEEKRPAYCIYFAGAMAALLRSRGIPARLVGGFVAAERNPLTGAMLVRARDAHAWVEAYLDGRWTAFDPTPWRSRDSALGIERRRGFAGAVLDAVLSALRRAWNAPAETLGRLARSPITLTAAALLALWLIAKRLRRRAPRGRAAKTVEAELDPRLAAAYGRYLEALGLQPRASETDDELLARFRAARGEGPAAAAVRFLEAYRRGRYRGEQIDDLHLARALEEMATARSR